jgi:hypothetical protein
VRPLASKSKIACALKKLPRARSVEFEALACEVVLSTKGLTSEEIDSGLVGGSRDGAIDAAYVFVGGVLVQEDSDYLKAGSSVTRQAERPIIRVQLVQAKESNGFAENFIMLATINAARLLDVDRDAILLRGQFSDDVIEKTERFIAVHNNLRGAHPTIEIDYTYVSVADEVNVHPQVVRALDDFKTTLSSIVFGATVTAGTRGIESISGHLRRRPSYDGLLKVETLTVHEREPGSPSWLTLVTLRNYLAFLTDPDDASYRDHFFSDNVRDFYKSAPVNLQIAETLSDPGSPEFWWLNNGVTVVCAPGVHAPGKSLNIKDVQIVNGLQTSRSIWDALSAAKPDNPLLDHCVLVRVIPTPDKHVRDMVIRATNSQTPVTSEGLRATSETQLRIEEFLLESDYFYDRRRNYYRNHGKPLARIVSIRQLAQCLLAWVKLRPDDARARPTDYLKTTTKHDSLFAPSLPKSIFAWVLDAQARVEQFLAAQENSDSAEVNDLRFLLASAVAKNLATSRTKIAQQLVAAGAPDRVISERRLNAAYRKINAELDKRQRKDSKVRRDQLVKNRAFVDSVVGR